MEKKFEPLSDAEKRVLIKIMEGRCVKQIAYELSMAFDTAQNHCKSIRKKFGRVTMAGCVYRAMRTRAIDESELPGL